MRLRWSGRPLTSTKMPLLLLEGEPWSRSIVLCPLSSVLCPLTAHRRRRPGNVAKLLSRLLVFLFALSWVLVMHPPQSLGQSSVTIKYVDAENGQDLVTRDGSLLQPWKTIRYAVDRTKSSATPTNKVVIRIRGRLDNLVVDKVILYDRVLGEDFPIKPVLYQHLEYDIGGSETFTNGQSVPVIISGLDGGLPSGTCLQPAGGASNLNLTVSNLTIIAFSTGVDLVNTSPKFSDCVFNQCDIGMKVTGSVLAPSNPLVVDCDFKMESGTGGKGPPLPTGTAHVDHSAPSGTSSVAGTWLRCKFRSGPKPNPGGPPPSGFAPTITYGFKSAAIDGGVANAILTNCKFTGGYNYRSGTGYQGMHYGIHASGLFDGQNGIQITNGWVGYCDFDGIFILAENEVPPSGDGDDVGEGIQGSAAPIITGTTVWKNGSAASTGDKGHGIVLRSRTLGFIQAQIDSCTKDAVPSGQYPKWGISSNSASGIYLHPEPDIQFTAFPFTNIMKNTLVHAQPIQNNDIFSNGKEGLFQNNKNGTGSMTVLRNRLYENGSVSAGANSGVKAKVEGKDRNPLEDTASLGATLKNNFIYNLTPADGSIPQLQDFGVYTSESEGAANMYENVELNAKLVCNTVTNHRNFGGVLIDSDGVGSLGLENVIYYNFKDVPSNNDINDLAAAVSSYCCTTPQVANGIIDMPQLINFGAGDLHLSIVGIGSPCIDKGIVDPQTPIDDIDVQMRPVDWTGNGASPDDVDFGADEIQN